MTVLGAFIIGVEAFDEIYPDDTEVSCVTVDSINGVKKDGMETDVSDSPHSAF